MCLVYRYDQEGEPSQLAAVDIFVSTVDPLKEPPLVTANTVLSILAVDYPVDKVSCYVSDDGAAMLTLETLAQTSEFARKWVPFCKKYNIEPRAPESFFVQKIDFFKDIVQTSFVKDRIAMKVQMDCSSGSTFVYATCVSIIFYKCIFKFYLPFAFHRENTKTLKFVLMNLLRRQRKIRKKSGKCKMVRRGLEITSKTIRE
jgi:hypothetical protein